MADRDPPGPASDACGCDAFASIFDRRTAARDRERYERAGTAYGLVLPRDRWITRVMIALANLTYRLRRRAYRAYVHPTTRVDEIAAGNGLAARAERQTWIWRVVVYDRAVAAGASA